METHCGILAWRIPWRSLAGYSPWVPKSWTRLKRLSTHAPKTTLRTATSNRVTRSRGLCHRPVAPAWEPSPSRPSSPHGDTERERNWLKVTQQVPGRAGKRTPAHLSPSLGFPEGGCQPAILASPSPGLPGCSRPWFMTPRSPSEVCRAARPWARRLGPRRLQIDRACAALVLHLIRLSFSSPGFLAAFKLSHKIYLLFHEYISSRQAQAFYIFTLYIFHGRLIAVSEAERGSGGEREQTEPAAGGGGREAAGRRAEGGQG